MIPSKESLLQSIQPWMRLSKSLFLKIYGYELSYPGFAEQAISVLESSGYNMARQYYNQSVLEYEQKKDEDLKPVAEWYGKQCVEKYEREVSEWKRQREAARLKEDLQKMSDRELLILLQNMS